MVHRTIEPAPQPGVMSALHGLLERFWDSFERAERVRRERWLGQSADIYDLERRLRQLERHGSPDLW